jgi:pimeloyl-ACP methyl ester carboxylesterase
VPATRYARTPDGDSIAYQTVGGGPLDVVYVPGFGSHVELFWMDPSIADFYHRLASFSRLILFDKRGTGLSDPLHGPQPLEERIEDVRAVMDAAGSERAALVGLSEGCAMATVFAASYPHRTAALVLCGPIVGGPSATHPAGARWDAVTEKMLAALDHFGDGGTLRLIAPSSLASDEQLGAVERAAASPGMARALIEMWLQIDLRDVLPTISVPTLVIARTEELFPIEAARAIAAQTPGARLVELPGADHVPWQGDTDAYVGEIEEFLTGVREHRTNRVLATVLITDVVASTARAADVGDAAWRHLLARHDGLVHRELRRFSGRAVAHTGDGVLAVFDGPARAIRCAQAIATAACTEVGLDIRAGIHTGEVEVEGEDLRGLAVHIAARVSAHARPGEVLVSRTVKELVIGSGLDFVDRGMHELKGVPDRWQLYAVAGGDTVQVPGHRVAGMSSEIG